MSFAFAQPDGQQARYPKSRTPLKFGGGTTVTESPGCAEAKPAEAEVIETNSKWSVVSPLSRTTVGVSSLILVRTSGAFGAGAPITTGGGATRAAYAGVGLGPAKIPPITDTAPTVRPLTAAPITGGIDTPPRGLWARSDSGPIARRSRPMEMFRNARTTSGSNWVPLHRAISSRAVAASTGALYERADVITSKTSATDTMRAA